GPVAEVVPPGRRVDELQPDDGVGDGNPFPAVVGDCLRGFVIAALGIADFLGDIADVGDAVGVKLRPVVERADDVGTGAGGDGGGDPRLDCQPVDAFKVDFEPEDLLRQVVELGPDHLV